MALKYQADLDPNHLPAGIIANDYCEKTDTWRDPKSFDKRPYPYYCFWCKRNVWLEQDGLQEHLNKDQHKAKLAYSLQVDERKEAQHRRTNVCVPPPPSLDKEILLDHSDIAIPRKPRYSKEYPRGFGAAPVESTEKKEAKWGKTLPPPQPDKSSSNAEAPSSSTYKKKSSGEVYPKPDATGWREYSTGKEHQEPPPKFPKPPPSSKCSTTSGHSSGRHRSRSRRSPSPIRYVPQFKEHATAVVEANNDVVEIKDMVTNLIAEFAARPKASSVALTPKPVAAINEFLPLSVSSEMANATTLVSPPPPPLPSTAQGERHVHYHTHVQPPPLPMWPQPGAGSGMPHNFQGYQGPQGYPGMMMGAGFVHGPQFHNFPGPFPLATPNMYIHNQQPGYQQYPQPSYPSASHQVQNQQNQHW
jgi:hypothetical protein